jgi:hypothetical protein
MALLSLRVIGPRSECSTQVRTQNQLTGATVDVYANSTHVADRVVS